MGASALISALSALPLEEDESAPSTDDEQSEESPEVRMTSRPPQRPKSEPSPRRADPVSRMHSSLQTLRPMIPATEGEHYTTRSQPGTSRSPPRRAHSPPGSPHSPLLSPDSRHSHLTFPYKENVITRRARGPSLTELQYQHAPTGPEGAHAGLPGPPRVESSSTLKQIAAEIVDTSNAVEDVEGYALGQPEHGDLAVEAPETTPQMLQRVFGLQEEEELIEEMQCWLLRSDSKVLHSR